jgi:hypothetical protein
MRLKENMLFQIPQRKKSMFDISIFFPFVPKGRLQKQNKKSNWNFPFGVSTPPPLLQLEKKNKEKYFICLFHVSEHFVCLFLKPSLNEN